MFSPDKSIWRLNYILRVVVITLILIPLFRNIWILLGDYLWKSAVTFISVSWTIIAFYFYIDANVRRAINIWWTWLIVWWIMLIWLVFSLTAMLYINKDTSPVFIEYFWLIYKILFWYIWFQTLYLSVIPWRPD